MTRRVLWMAVCVAASLSLGCGGDDEGDDNGSALGGTGGGGSTTGGTGGGDMIPGEGIPCGTMRCGTVEGAMGGPCCYDAFDSACGMQVSVLGENACLKLVEPDDRCPSASLGPVQLTSCCTADNQCGVNSPFNPQCTELGAFEQAVNDRISMIGGDEDGGMSGPPGGFMIDLPDPQPCE